MCDKWESILLTSSHDQCRVLHNDVYTRGAFGTSSAAEATYFSDVADLLQSFVEKGEVQY